MFINPEYIKCVTFLIERGDPIATVFLITVSNDIYSGKASGYGYYAVTARHAIKGKQVSIRFNRKDGTTQDEAIPPDDWVLHATTDLAVLQIKFPLDEYDLFAVDYWDIPVDDKNLSFLADGPEPTPHTEYGVGDEVFTLGLFEGHTGERLTQPVLRFGHLALGLQTISAQLDLDSEDLTPIEALLVEIAAWKGQSGSPVFLRSEFIDHRDRCSRKHDRNHLIGVIQSYYPAEYLITNDIRYRINMGLAIVVPAQQVKELLMSEELKLDRKRALDKRCWK